MGQQIGWSQEAKLLYKIKQQLKQLTKVASKVNVTTTTTTTII